MIYEYQCEDCQHRFEVWAKMSDPAPSLCPKCQGTRLEKVISATNFALKGSGWHNVDYKRPVAPSSSSSSAVSAAKPSPSATTSSSSTEKTTTPLKKEGI